MAVDLYTTPNENNPAAQTLAILKQVIAAEGLEKKLASARRSYLLQAKTHEEWIDTAEKNNIVTKEEATQLRDVYAARMNIINVDDFAADVFA